MNIRTALDRTILLMRDVVSRRVDDHALLHALTNTRIALIADNLNIASHSAQSAFVTAAMLMARSGHEIHLLAPDCPLMGAQLPLSSSYMLQGLLDVGNRMLPGIAFGAYTHTKEYDLAIALGDSPIMVAARRSIRLNAGPWTGQILPSHTQDLWGAQSWPLGGMAAGVLGAAEAFKVAMWKLGALEPFPENVRDRLCPTEETSFPLAPPDTPFCRHLGDFECISAGAITNAILFILTRIPGVTGNARIFDSETPDLTNLNRYMLLLRSSFALTKVSELAKICSATLPITPVAERYSADLASKFSPLAPLVLTGVDHIPSRWDVQLANPAWLGVGATSHWDAMASYHQSGTACARCLHPRSTENNAPIPTVAFVSFWAGLLTTSYFLRQCAENPATHTEQHVYLTALRPEHPHWASVRPNPDCPTCKSLLARTGRQHVTV